MNVELIKSTSTSNLVGNSLKTLAISECAMFCIIYCYLTNLAVFEEFGLFRLYKKQAIGITISKLCNITSCKDFPIITYNNMFNSIK